MSDIELVIKIPENLYKATINGLDANEIWDLRLAIKNGTPFNEVLDKIRVEIVNLEEGISSYHNDRPWIFKDEVLQIIDKYRGEVDCRECKAEHDCYECKKYTESREDISIPYLMHKEIDMPISECQKAYDVAIDYLRSQGKVKG